MPSHSMDLMKGQPIQKRFVFALKGIAVAWREPNFRIQTVLGLGALCLFAISGASAIWWALLSITIGGVLTAELFNTALEHLSDHLHPEHHIAIAWAKDCAAGSVLFMSLASLGVLAAYLSTLLHTFTM